MLSTVRTETTSRSAIALLDSPCAARGSWTRKEIAYGIASLPAALAGPRHLAVYARQHWAIEDTRAAQPWPAAGLRCEDGLEGQ